RRRAAFAFTIAALMLAEYASRPLDLRRIPTTPPDVYARIVRDSGDSPTPALFEFPASAHDDPTWMYYSTFHWPNLVNGYSGFCPPEYVRLLKALKEFPDQESFEAIKSHGPRYLVVHGERLYGARYETLIPDLDKRRDLSLLVRSPFFDGATHGEISVYRIS